MIQFYNVNENYMNYLRSIEPKIPNIDYGKRKKFICGIVLNIYGHEYYAPISHIKTNYVTSILITDEKNRPISSIRFSFMFPARPEAIIPMNFSRISIEDSRYADLLKKEYLFCENNEKYINKKALHIYKSVLSGNNKLCDICCNFSMLEGFSLLWQPPEKERINKQDDFLITI